MKFRLKGRDIGFRARRFGVIQVWEFGLSSELSEFDLSFDVLAP